MARNESSPPGAGGDVADATILKQSPPCRMHFSYNFRISFGLPNVHTSTMWTWTRERNETEKKNGKLTFACSIAAWAAFSASRCRLSFSFNEKMATDLARFTRLCFILDFLAANSAAFTAASSSDPLESLPASIDSLWCVPAGAAAGAGEVTGTADEEDAPGLSALDLVPPPLEVDDCGLSW